MTAPIAMGYAEASNLAKNNVNERYLAFLRGSNSLHQTPMHMPVINSVGKYSNGKKDVQYKISFAPSGNDVTNQMKGKKLATTPENMRIIVESLITRLRVGGWYRLARLFAVSSL